MAAITRESALPGRAEPIPTSSTHLVNGRAIKPPFPEGVETVLLGMGCFWGAEKKFWALDGVHVTAVGYAGGITPNPTYKEVCSGQTGHAEVVLVAYDPRRVSLRELLRVFWQSHDPTQGMRQGNDVGTQYRSAVYVSDDSQLAVVEEAREAYRRALASKGVAASITTEIAKDRDFFYAEEYHQQYLERNPAGYCGLGGTGVLFPETPFQ